MKYRRSNVLLSILLGLTGGACSGAQSPPSDALASGTQAAGSAAAPAAPAAGAALLPPAQGAFASGAYRNLFVEVGLPAAAVEQKVAAAYEQLFHGPPEQRVMFDAGHNERGPLAYIHDVGNDDVRSEGMSYGMMIAVQLDRKQDFDALWNWSKTYMQMSKEGHPVQGYFSWKLQRDGSVVDEMPAPDGEEYFATALLFAAHRWGNGQGIFDYTREAHQLLDALRNRKPITGTVKGNRQTTCVALFNPEHVMVRFTPDMANFVSNGDHTDPSYHLPAFYEVWARWGPEADRGFWEKAALASRGHFVAATHPETALSPDFSNFDGSPKAVSWDPKTVNFRYDAWRTAMNWAVDYAWWAKDARQVELSNRLLRFFAGQGERYGSNYELSGKPTNTDHSEGLISTNAVAVLAASDPVARRFVEELYTLAPPTGKWRYYDGMLYMMGLLHVSGNFRIYAPAQ
jgi:oligosaccharide reducing-end xylanase